MSSRVACLAWIVPLALGGLPACAFDQTQVPPLPDEVLHFSPGGPAADTTGPGGCEATCSREEPPGADFGPATGALTGTWGRRVIQRTERDTREDGNWKDSSWTTYERVTVLHEGRRLRETAEVCAITMDLIDGARTGFPEKLFERLPIMVEEGDFLATAGTDVAGVDYASPAPLVRLYGLAPGAADKEWERCGSYFDDADPGAECPLALWPEIVDTDCDCHPGITLDMTVGAAATEQVYMVQRDVMERSGTVEDADRIAGTLSTFRQDNANLGSSQAMLKSNPPSRVVEGASTFVMERLPDGADCRDVPGAAYDR
jgi:hypothetical protein